MAVDASKCARVHEALLGWFGANRRDLPWRRTRDPYAVLVAEVMLQQTQVERVIPKWRAWLERFPTLRDLADASRSDAIRAWQGLGYNLRAVRLHALAREVQLGFGGQLPRDVPGLLTLTGVGRYTAGAVACFAYEQPVAMVDTNIRRVLSRVFAASAADVQAIADEVVPKHAAYAWNQALMDLGATVCRARRPLCLVCPLVHDCGGPRETSPSRPPQGGFEGSSRYYRGRIVDLLRQVSDAPLAEVAARVGGGVELVERLAEEGLVSIGADERVRLAAD